jgi:hypothetical protein
VKTFDVQSTAINASFDRAFDFIAAPENLSRWTSAFSRASDGKALMQSPAGPVEIALTVEASRKYGTVDWFMTFPDGSAAKAYRRLIYSGPNSCMYSFILTAPPVSLKTIEDALEQQCHILADELPCLRKIIEQSPSRAES